MPALISGIAAISVLVKSTCPESSTVPLLRRAGRFYRKGTYVWDKRDERFPVVFVAIKQRIAKDENRKAWPKRSIGLLP